MKWSRNLKVLRRGVRLATQIAQAELGLGTPTAPPARPRRTEPGIEEVAAFGRNPGRLRMLVRRPKGGIKPHQPLIVVLHGCGQDAASFATAAGWAALSDRIGVPLILPVQSDLNHQHRCFRWFQPAHTARGRGEAESIAEMVATGLTRFDADPRRVFVVGLSAGGAMAAALLAAYPELFAAGAVVAGLPVGAAHSPMQALARMAQAGPDQSADAWVAAVREVAPPAHAGPWPRLSIWQGGADTVVDPANASLLALQWRALLGLPETPTTDISRGPIRCRRWGPAAAPGVELWTIPGLAHGYPIAQGRAAPFVPLAGVAATTEIAAFWGL
ncbi:MAG: PHB depolymerase family esterase [Rhodospirillales bacterium]|nr:PHB depolymerase family esterase [Rhodospirillales bacterium]